MRLLAALVLLASCALAALITSREHSALSTFVSNVGSARDAAEVAANVRELATGMGMRNSAAMLYPGSPNTKAAYDAIYDTLLFISTTNPSSSADGELIRVVIKYFERNLI